MRIASVILLSGAALALLAAPASARGCNGVVNQLVWGCAAWDNNNGPQYPNYHAPAQPARQAAPAYSNTPPQVVNRNGNGLISQDGGTALPRNGNGLISQDGGTFRH